MTGIRHSDHHEDAVGDPVYTADGYRLGRVLLTRGDELVVERDTFARQYYVLDGRDIDRVENRALITRLTRNDAEARRWGT